MHKIGILLVHGFNGSTNDFAELTAILHKQGFVTRNMLLPGHGNVPIHEMYTLGWHDWSDAVTKELLLLQEQCERVFLIGHSMGGALSLHVAAHHQVAGMVIMCAPIHLNSWLYLPAVRIAKRFAPSVPSLPGDIRDRNSRQRYDQGVRRPTAFAPVESMLMNLPTLRAELPHVTAPILLMNAAHDRVVPPRDTITIYHLLGSSDKHLVTMRHSSHVIMHDRERAEVFDRTITFIQTHQ
jgi:carboxylesterase